MSDQTPRFKIPYPSRAQNNYFETMQSGFNAIDSNFFASFESRNTIFMGGATLEWRNYGAEGENGPWRLSWSSAITMRSPSFGMPVSVGPSTIEVPPGQYLLVDIPRGPTVPVELGGFTTGSQVPVDQVSQALAYHEVETNRLIWITGLVLVPNSTTDNGVYPIIEVIDPTPGTGNATEIQSVPVCLGASDPNVGNILQAQDDGAGGLEWCLADIPTPPPVSGANWTTADFIVGLDDSAEYYPTNTDPAKQTIQQALDAASLAADPENDIKKTVFVKAGVYTENLTIPQGVSLIGAGPSNPEFPSPMVTTIRGAHTIAQRIVDFSDPTTPADAPAMQKWMVTIESIHAEPILVEGSPVPMFTIPKYNQAAQPNGPVAAFTSLQFSGVTANVDLNATDPGAQFLDASVLNIVAPTEYPGNFNMVFLDNCSLWTGLPSTASPAFSTGENDGGKIGVITAESTDLVIRNSDIRYFDVSYQWERPALMLGTQTWASIEQCNIFGGVIANGYSVAGSDVYPIGDVVELTLMRSRLEGMFYDWGCLTPPCSRGGLYVGGQAVTYIVDTDFYTQGVSAPAGAANGAMEVGDGEELTCAILTTDYLGAGWLGTASDCVTNYAAIRWHILSEYWRMSGESNSDYMRAGCAPTLIGDCGADFNAASSTAVGYPGTFSGGVSYFGCDPSEVTSYPNEVDDGGIRVCGYTTFGVLEVSSLAVMDDARVFGELRANGGLQVNGTTDLAGDVTIDGDVTIEAGHEVLIESSDLLNPDGDLTAVGTITGFEVRAERGGVLPGTSAGGGRVSAATEVVVDAGGTFQVGLVGDPASPQGVVDFRAAVRIDGSLDLDIPSGAGSGNISTKGTIETTQGLIDPADPFDASNLSAVEGLSGVSRFKYLEVTDEAKLPTTEVDGDLNLSGNLTGAVGEGNLTAAGNADISGTLDVTGATTLGTATITQANMTNANVTGTLDVATLDVDSLDLDGNLDVSGTSSLQGAVTAGDSVAVTGTLDVTGTTTLGVLNVNELDVNDLDLTGALEVGTTSTLTGQVTAQAGVDVAGALTAASASVAGPATVGGSGTVGGALQVGGAVSADSVTTTNDATIGADLTVSGSTSLQNATIQELDLTDIDLTGDLEVTGTSTLTGNVTAGANVTATGTVTGAGLESTGGLTVDGNSRLGDSISDNTEVLGDLSATGDLQVDGTTTLGTTAGGANPDQLTVNALSDFTGLATFNNDINASGLVTAASLKVQPGGTADIESDLTVGKTTGTAAKVTVDLGINQINRHADVNLYTDDFRAGTTVSTSTNTLYGKLDVIPGTQVSTIQGEVELGDPTNGVEPIRLNGPTSVTGNSGTLNVSQSLTVTGDSTLGSVDGHTLAVTGNSTFDGGEITSMTVNQEANFNNGLNSAGMSVDGSSDFLGQVTVGESANPEPLTVYGAITHEGDADLATAAGDVVTVGAAGTANNVETLKVNGKLTVTGIIDPPGLVLDDLPASTTQPPPFVPDPALPSQSIPWPEATLPDGTPNPAYSPWPATPPAPDAAGHGQFYIGPCPSTMYMALRASAAAGGAEMDDLPAKPRDLVYRDADGTEHSLTFPFDGFIAIANTSMVPASSGAASGTGFTKGDLVLDNPDLGIGPGGAVADNLVEFTTQSNCTLNWQIQHQAPPRRYGGDLHWYDPDPDPAIPNASCYHMRFWSLLPGAVSTTMSTWDGQHATIYTGTYSAGWNEIAVDRLTVAAALNASKVAGGLVNVNHAFVLATNDTLQIGSSALTFMG